MNARRDGAASGESGPLLTLVIVPSSIDAPSSHRGALQ